jgi:hypothetical protein
MLQVYTRGRRRNEDGSDLSEDVFFSKGTKPLHRRQVPPFGTWISRDFIVLSAKRIAVWSLALAGAAGLAALVSGTRPPNLLRDPAPRPMDVLLSHRGTGAAKEILAASIFPP